MGAVSARTDVRSIRLGNTKGRRQVGDGNGRKPRLYLVYVSFLVGPSRCRFCTPNSLRSFVSPLGIGVLLAGFRTLRGDSACFWKLN
jgi:hypothetical protein